MGQSEPERRIGAFLFFDSAAKRGIEDAAAVIVLVKSTLA
jgi:hypothetical protein